MTLTSSLLQSLSLDANANIVDDEGFLEFSRKDEFTSGCILQPMLISISAPRRTTTIFTNQIETLSMQIVIT